MVRDLIANPDDEDDANDGDDDNDRMKHEDEPARMSTTEAQASHLLAHSHHVPGSSSKQQQPPFQMHSDSQQDPGMHSVQPDASSLAAFSNSGTGGHPGSFVMPRSDKLNPDSSGS
jgi:hypothetical protein